MLAVKSVSYEIEDGRQVDGGVRCHFRGALFKALERLRRPGNIPLAQVEHGFVDLQVVGKMIVRRLFDRLDAPN